MHTLAVSVNPFLGVHPSTPQSVVIDQRLEVIFIHAPALNMETIQETATFLLNNMTLSNFFLSLFNSNNQQLIRHITFPNEFDEVGNFTLSIGELPGFLRLCMLMITSLLLLW